MSMPLFHDNLIYHSTLRAAQTVLQGRLDAEKILRGDDDRLLVVVG